MIFFWSFRIASTINAADAPGAYHALVPTSLVISAPPFAVRVQISSSFAWDSMPMPTSSVSGMPATVEYRGSGTIVSPCPPSTNAVTSSTDTCSSIAMKVRMRAESSTPAMPITRSRGNPLSRYTACDIASSGLATGTMIVLGECLTTSAVTSCMIL